MSKVDTLLKLIAYQKQHPPSQLRRDRSRDWKCHRGHVRRCQKEVNLLKHQLVEPTLQPGQIQFILSLLNQREPDQKEIVQQLQKQMGVSYTGSLRATRPNEEAPVSWLEIGELIPVEMGALDRLHPALSFWLQHLCYDPLLVHHRNGEIEGRLAIGCEPVKGNSQWQLTLRKDLRWSDGKPITLEEVIAAFSASSIAPIIAEIKPDGKAQLRIQLSQEEPLFPFHLRVICPLPSHSSQPYRVTSGPYRLKHFRPDAMTFRFDSNPDYYHGGDSHIDWLTLKRFTLPANAIKAIENGTLDLLFFLFMRCNPSTNSQRRCLVNSGPFLKITTMPYSSTAITDLFRTKGTVTCLKKQSIIRQSTATCAWDRLLRKKISHRFLTTPLTFGLPAHAASFAIWLISSESLWVLL